MIDHVEYTIIITLPINTLQAVPSRKHSSEQAPITTLVLSFIFIIKFIPFIDKRSNCRTSSFSYIYCITIYIECKLVTILTINIKLSTNHEGLSQPIMKMGSRSITFCLIIDVSRIKFDRTLEDLHPVCQRKCFTLENNILSHP